MFLLKGVFNLCNNFKKRPSKFWFNGVKAAVGDKRRRDFNRTVSLLEILDHGYHGPRHGDSGAVQHVDESVFPVPAFAAYIKAARLVVRAV
jgi:hypothetical protein